MERERTGEDRDVPRAFVPALPKRPQAPPASSIWTRELAPRWYTRKVRFSIGLVMCLGVAPACAAFGSWGLASLVALMGLSFFIPPLKNGASSRATASAQGPVQARPDVGNASQSTHGPIECPFCSASIVKDAKYLGQTILCPKCRASFTAPDSQHAERQGLATLWTGMTICCFLVGISIRVGWNSGWSVPFMLAGGVCLWNAYDASRRKPPAQPL